LLEQIKHDLGSILHVTLIITVIHECNKSILELSRKSRFLTIPVPKLSDSIQ